MSKTIIISNRLPLQIKLENDDLKVKPSVGGLATGLKSIHEEGNSVWIGWSGLTEEELNDEQAARVDESLRGYAGWIITNPTYLAELQALRQLPARHRIPALQNGHHELLDIFDEVEPDLGIECQSLR